MVISLGDGNTLYVVKNSFRVVGAIAELGRFYGLAKQDWLANWKEQHVKLLKARNEAHKMNSILEVEHLFHSVWDFLVERRLKTLGISDLELERVMVDLPEGYASWTTL